MESPHAGTQVRHPFCRKMIRMSGSAGCAVKFPAVLQTQQPSAFSGLTCSQFASTWIQLAVASSETRNLRGTAADGANLQKQRNSQTPASSRMDRTTTLYTCS